MGCVVGRAPGRGRSCESVRVASLGTCPDVLALPRRARAALTGALAPAFAQSPNCLVLGWSAGGAPQRVAAKPWEYNTVLDSAAASSVRGVASNAPVGKVAPRASVSRSCVLRRARRHSVSGKVIWRRGLCLRPKMSCRWLGPSAATGPAQIAGTRLPMRSARRLRQWRVVESVSKWAAVVGCVSFECPRAPRRGPCGSI